MRGLISENLVKKDHEHRSTHRGTVQEPYSGNMSAKFGVFLVNLHQNYRNTSRSPLQRPTLLANYDAEDSVAVHLINCSCMYAACH
jgi:hypothetical protein